MYTSETYGSLNIEQIPEKIQDYYEKMKHYDTDFQIVVGSDSQTFDTLKLVNVIAVVCEGHGGIFFHEITRLPRTGPLGYRRKAAGLAAGRDGQVRPGAAPRLPRGRHAGRREDHLRSGQALSLSHL